MFDKLMSVEEKELKCYEYFHTNCIESRFQLRECLKQKPLEGIRWGFIEEILSDFLFLKKQQKKKESEIRSNKQHSTTFTLSDMHIPYHDEKSCDLVFECMFNEQPDHLVFCGDIIDCYTLSRFDKRPDRMRNLQHEINILYKKLLRLKKHLPNTQIHYVLGNHEDRIGKTTAANPGLFGLQALDYPRLLKLDDLGIAFHDTKVIINDFIFYHGDVVRKDSANSAKEEYYSHNMHDGISGHTHRLGAYYKTYDQKAGFWVENGCLCTLEPEYIRDPDKANWQQGFTVIHHFDGMNQAEQVLINDHKFVYNGRIYK